MPQIPVTTRTATERPLVKVVNEALANPAAGAGFSIVVPVGYRFQVSTLFLRFVTDANVAGRIVEVTFSTPTGIIYRFTHTTAILAGETRFLTLAPGAPSLLWSATAMTAMSGLPPALVLEEGSSIDVTVVGIQVGDQFSLINSQVLSQFVAE